MAQLVNDAGNPRPTAVKRIRDVYKRQLIRHHEVAGVGLLELAEAVEDRPAQNAGQQKPQRLPCRGLSLIHI